MRVGRESTFKQTFGLGPILLAIDLGERRRRRGRFGIR
jgi:hypothetical protein